MSKFETYIGIDPDQDKSGVAMISGETFALSNMTFWELFDFLKAQKKSTLIVIEAGWLNSGTWHGHHRMSRAALVETGRRIGLSHATGRLIEEMVKYIGHPYRLVRPTASKKNAWPR